MHHTCRKGRVRCYCCIIQCLLLLQWRLTLYTHEAEAIFALVFVVYLLANSATRKPFVICKDGEPFFGD